MSVRDYLDSTGSFVMGSMKTSNMNVGGVIHSNSNNGYSIIDTNTNNTLIGFDNTNTLNQSSTIYTSIYSNILNTVNQINAATLAQIGNDETNITNLQTSVGNLQTSLSNMNAPIIINAVLNSYVLHQLATVNISNNTIGYIYANLISDNSIFNFVVHCKNRNNTVSILNSKIEGTRGGTDICNVVVSSSNIVFNFTNSFSQRANSQFSYTTNFYII